MEGGRSANEKGKTILCRLGKQRPFLNIIVTEIEKITIKKENIVKCRMKKTNFDKVLRGDTWDLLPEQGAWDLT